MLFSEYRRDLAMTVGIVILLSAVLAFYYRRSVISLSLDSLLLTVQFAAMFALGPFAGWILEAAEGEVVRALPVLLPPTVLSICPPVIAARATTSASRRRWLALAAVIWLFSSNLFLVFIWL